MLSAPDSPYSQLSDDDHLITRTDSFKTYLMYKPTGDSIWVSLSVISWGWTGTATKDADGKWTGSGSTTGDGNGIATTELPVWNDHVYNIREVVIAP